MGISESLESLNNLFKQLIDWLGEVWNNFIIKLIDRIKTDWFEIILPLLIAAFTLEAPFLYVIFYVGSVLGQAIMEIWNPKNIDQPPQLIKINQLPKNNPIPKQRSNRDVLKLENWN